MRRPQTTSVPEGEPTVRLGPGRAPGPGRSAAGAAADGAQSDRRSGEHRSDALIRRAPHHTVLDRYSLDRRLGAGGFGVVWRAHDLKLERDVAVKVVPRSGDDAQRSRTEREALAAARLNHPGIVALYEFGYDDHDIFLVSELVEGATLGELNEEGAVSDRDVARIGLALCDALAHAHARGVIHRDIKPANVMVLAEPAAGAGFAKLTDLGIAHVVGADELTAVGDVVGTLAYMAPEQAEGRHVTAACDVYGLALTLYEAWTGTNPVRAQGPAATARRVGLALPPLHSLRRDLPPELGEVIDAALDPNPECRPGPAELREVLGEVEEELSDRGGLVEPETLERFGITAVRARTRLATLMHRGDAVAAPRVAEARAARRGAALAARVAAGVGAALMALAAFAWLGPEPSFSPLAPAAIAALGIAVLPRAGWLVTATAVCLWAATEGGQPGTALVLGVGLAVTPLLLPRAGTLWSIPALAPLLGAAGLVPMFVGLAALARTPWRRAALGAAGFVWLALAEVLTDRDLLFGVADGTLARARWEGSAVNALGDALAPLVFSPALAPALAWAAFAFLLPLVVRGRWAAVDLVVAGAWAVGLVVAQGALAFGAAPSRAQGAVVGAGLGALVTVTLVRSGLKPPERSRSARRDLPPRDVIPGPALP